MYKNITLFIKNKILNETDHSKWHLLLILILLLLLFFQFLLHRPTSRATVDQAVSAKQNPWELEVFNQTEVIPVARPILSSHHQVISCVINICLTNYTGLKMKKRETSQTSPAFFLLCSPKPCNEPFSHASSSSLPSVSISRSPTIAPVQGSSLL